MMKRRKDKALSPEPERPQDLEKAQNLRAQRPRQRCDFNDLWRGDPSAGDLYLPVGSGRVCQSVSQSAGWRFRCPSPNQKGSSAEIVRGLHGGVTTGQLKVIHSAPTSSYELQAAAPTPSPASAPAPTRS